MRTVRRNSGAQTLCTIFFTIDEMPARKEKPDGIYMRDGHHRGATDEIYVPVVVPRSRDNETRIYCTRIEGKKNENNIYCTVRPSVYRNSVGFFAFAGDFNDHA